MEARSGPGFSARRMVVVGLLAMALLATVLFWPWLSGETVHPAGANPNRVLELFVYTVEANRGVIPHFSTQETSTWSSQLSDKEDVADQQEEFRRHREFRTVTKVEGKHWSELDDDAVVLEDSRGKAILIAKDLGTLLDGG